jgi:hypothetical protein
MARKKHSITLSFLDLLFALFAALTMLNIMLAITKGRTAHRLEKDFLLIRVRWNDSVRGVKGFADLTGQARLTDAGGKEVPWAHEQPPDLLPDQPLESVFLAAPLGAGSWRFAGHDQVWGHAEHVEVSTRKGGPPRLLYPRGGPVTLSTSEGGS